MSFILNTYPNEEAFIEIIKGLSSSEGLLLLFKEMEMRGEPITLQKVFKVTVSTSNFELMKILFEQGMRWDNSLISQDELSYFLNHSLNLPMYDSKNVLELLIAHGFTLTSQEFLQLAKTLQPTTLLTVLEGMFRPEEVSALLPALASNNINLSGLLDEELARKDLSMMTTLLRAGVKFSTIENRNTYLHLIATQSLPTDQIPLIVEALKDSNFDLSDVVRECFKAPYSIFKVRDSVFKVNADLVMALLHAGAPIENDMAFYMTNLLSRFSYEGQEQQAGELIELLKRNNFNFHQKYMFEQNELTPIAYICTDSKFVIPTIFDLLQSDIHLTTGQEVSEVLKDINEKCVPILRNLDSLQNIDLVLDILEDIRDKTYEFPGTSGRLTPGQWAQKNELWGIGLLLRKLVSG